MTSIPHELVASIVDELQHDRGSLKSCSTVSSSFCPPSQRHLFRSMWLHRENWKHYTPTQRALQAGNSVPSGTIKGAFNLLSESPHLAAYVRDLTVDLPDSADEDAPLEHILRTAANLERFVVFGLAARWMEIPPVLESALLDVFARPTLNGLHFLHLHGIPTRVIHRALTSLKVLSFYNTSAAPDQYDEPASQASPASVEELILCRNMSTTHMRIVSANAPPLAQLRRLFLWSGVDNLANRLLTLSAETLEHIEIDCGALESPLNLPALISVKKIQTVKLHISCGLARWLPPGFARTIADLGSVQPPTLHLVFSVQDGISSDEWILEGPILHEEEGESLKTTTIHCQFAFLDPPHKVSDRKGLFESFCAGMRAALPGLKLEFERVDRRISYVGRLPL
ncbi:hypothetical protein FB45DRAFT_939141 [Roridomyces roridus]|uniref:Uncharacterized protein n=1 Tax=Roridomyces roridus TaxID=1738132 RepID=A0AAD7B8I9_9AGAR|nr:hypothetical protein FB45DRAFT_939141 [Roridomyces roridus]